MYCAIIPKDYEFKKEEIILLWRAQGFLQEARDKQCIHDLGHKYFNDLVSRSLLQVCVNNNSRFVMHDLINDLAQSVAGEVCFKIEGSQQISKHARHLSYIAEEYDGTKKFKGIYEAQHLRTFLPLRLSSVFPTYHLTNHVLTNLLPDLRCLRALSLEGYQITILPEFVGDLKLLRITEYNEPRDAWMARLSDKSRIGNLKLQWSKDFVNRREEVEKKVLDGLQPSKKLMELSIKFYCGEMLANWVGDSSFNCLQSLCLDGCINLLSLPSIGKLPLLKKVRIKGLRSVRTVGVEFFGENTTNTFSSLEILEFEDMLNWEKWNLCEVDEEARKFPKLLELLIQNCPLLLGSMPEDLPSLKKLAIRSWKKLIISVQNFPLLSELVIWGCHEVIYKGFADYSSTKRISFGGISKFSCAAECLRLRSIKVELFEIDDCEELWSSRKKNWGLLTQSMSPRYLRISNCPQLVSIGTEEEREKLMQLKIPSSTVKMIIQYCERLEKLSTTLYFLTLLMKLELIDCPKLISLARSNLPSKLKVLSISYCKNLQCLLLDEGEDADSNNACVLQKLDILCCESLKRINRIELPSTLKTLEIHECPQLESISQEIQDNSSLESIEIYGCDMLKGLPQGLNKLKHFTLNLNTLKELEIRDCPNVTSILKEGIPTHLTSLTIGGPNIWKAILERDLHTLTCLKSLSISNGCLDAVSFPQDEIGVTLPSSLIHLRFSDFPKLESLSSNGFRNLSSLQFLTIEKCPNLKTLPRNNTLSSLLALNIVGCPMMEELCKWDKGPQWSKISHIPYVAVLK
ncbi:putative disease resistance protein At3g14460 [Gossypium arboreum]|uniref:putative disease resistance protein At3g14460 n=1 Tax=Gossypium arboreum TaxID=29729 RepID=UPI0022F1C8DD|nr:putative disease resistance protein At3g14460 [Gossypium arboreum]